MTAHPLTESLADALVGRHTATDSAAQWFAIPPYTDEQVPGVVEEATLQLAVSMLLTTPDGPELTIALRRLLDVRDSWGRAMFEADDA